jgi:hypothetical protein
MKDPNKKNPIWLRVISMFGNPWFWHIVFLRVLYTLFPFLDKTIKLYSPPLDATLVGLDGTTKYSLLNDIVKKTPFGTPLIINIGSYN